MEFGVKLKKLRTEKGISQQELADKVYVSRSAVAKWENGLGYPSRDSLDALLGFFEIEESFFATEQVETVIIKKNRHIYLLRVLLGFVGFVLLLFCVFLGYRHAHTVKATDTEGIKLQMIEYFEDNYRRIGLTLDSVQITDIEIRGNYMAVLAKTDVEYWCMCVFERDRFFANRWRRSGGKPHFSAGSISAWNFGSPQGEAVLIFSGGELDEKAKWYTFTNGGIEYCCPIENRMVLNLFVIPNQCNISGCPVLLDEEKKEIPTYDPIVYY